ncbi:MAG: tRNA lysidine(34) synthetase TilS [Acutalibacteraceae bacterium]
MICDVKKTIEKYAMLKSGETVAVGVSGGADSVCLLHILSKIRGEYDIVLKAVHINHNIRGEESKRDENFVRSLCAKLGVEFILFSEDIPALSKKYKISEEECGRKVRYECFEKVGADKIATAHTLSDSAETVLFNLARGTTLKGLCGISPKRGKIIRPLIEMTRKDIERYCKENQLFFVTDSTNLSDDYTRNKIRHNVIPVLEEINRGFEKNIARFISAAQAENSFLEKCADELLEKSKTESGFKLSCFLSADEAVAKRAIMKLLSEHMNKNAESRHVDLFYNGLKNKSDIQLAKDLFIRFDGDIISLCKNQREKTENEFWQCELKDNVFKTPYKTFEVSILKNSPDLKTDIFNFVNADLLDFNNLCLRSRKSGDTFTDIRRKNTKTLKKLFSEKHIPLEQRQKIAVLSNQDGVIWIDKIGTDAKYIVNKDTEKVIVIKAKDD